MSEPQSQQPRTSNTASPAPIVGRGHPSARSFPSPRYTDAITDSPRPSDGLRLARPRRSRGERPGGAPEPGGNPAAERDRELLRNRHRDALTEHTEPSRLDLVEQGEVDPPHDLGRHERARVGRGKVLPCDPVELPRAYRLVGHRSEEHTSELQSLAYLVCRLLLEKNKA